MDLVPEAGDRMRRRQFITLLAGSTSRWPQDVRVRYTDWVHLILTLSAMAYMLSSPSSLSQELLSQGIESGSEQQVFNNACRTCHTIKEGDNRLGPNLYKVVGRKAGSLPNYGYSSAMQSADFVWDKATLDRFIANPDSVVNGNKMKPYGGLASSADRAKLVDFLETQR